MIDKSNEVFNAVATQLRAKFKPITVVGEYVSVPAKFPCVSVDETYNVPVHMDSAVHNKYARVRYRLQVFSNLDAGKRAQARAIYDVADRVMHSLGLYAKSYTSMPTQYNSLIYTITVSYEGVIDENGVIYRN